MKRGPSYLKSDVEYGLLFHISNFETHFWAPWHPSDVSPRISMAHFSSNIVIILNRRLCNEPENLSQNKCVKNIPFYLKSDIELQNKKADIRLRWDSFLFSDTFLGPLAPL